MRNKERFKKILKDIFLLEPKLKSNKKKLEETIKVLLESKSSIKIDNKFKGKLKNRLRNIIKIKQNNKKVKTNYIKIFSTIFTGLITVFGFFYVFKDNLFFSSNVPKNIIKSREIFEYNFKKSVKDDIKQNTKTEKKDKENKQILEDKDIKKDINLKTLQNQDNNVGGSVENNLPKDSIKLDLLKDKDINNNIGEKGDKNSEINSIFGVEDIKEETSQINENNTKEDDTINLDIGGDIDTIRSIDTTSDFNFNGDNLEIKKDSFKDYCLDIGGDFKEDLDLCTLDDKSCNIEDYNHGLCLKLLGIDDDINIYIEDFIEEYSK